MNAKETLHSLAMKAPITLPKDMNELYDAVVATAKEKAVAGFLGCSFTLKIPDHLSDYIPHMIADLRSGGISVDVVGMNPEKDAVFVFLMLTW